MNTALVTMAPLCTLLLACANGCNSPIVAEFETARRLAAQQNKELFVYYESWLSADCGQMKKPIQSGAAQQWLADKIVCILDESYEPNQRFVAQYGVHQFPAVILIHRDGTYHQRTALMTADTLREFVRASSAPGRRPTINPQIPRSVDYLWQADYEQAFRLAEQHKRPVFIFYKSVISADCNEMLLNVFSRPDVAEHFNGTINCLLDWGYPPNRRLMAKYGITNVPGIVIVNPDGTQHVRQGRMTAPQIISFVRSAKSPARPTPPSS